MTAPMPPQRWQTSQSRRLDDLVHLIVSMAKIVAAIAAIVFMVAVNVGVADIMLGALRGR